LKALIFKHLEFTESPVARAILNDWATYEPLFWKVVVTANLPPAKPLPPAETNVPVKV
jgi:glutamate synthase domain-containing protein 3